MGKAIRQLAYKDRSVWHLEQVVSSIFDDCDGLTDRYVFPDMTTRVPFVMLLSQEQFTTLYSAVLTGADLTYPDTSHDVENLFLQIVTCPMNQFCAALINCLENDPDTLAALMALLADNGLTGGVGDPNAPMADDILGGNLLPDGYACTDDKAFGMALAIVDALNDATTEVLQAIEILTNPVEIAAELGDNLPGVGALASAGDIANWIQDTAKEQYDLAWSTTVRDELACLLWCEFKLSCHLSFNTVWDVYLGAAGVAPPPGVLLTDWLAWLIALPFVAALSTVATVSLLGLLAMRYGGHFGDFQLGIQSLETVIQLSEDASSSDWSIVCDPCAGAWCYEFDFSVAPYWIPGGRDPGNTDEWFAYYTFGEWYQDMRNDVGAGKWYAFSLYIPVPTGTILTRIDVEDEVTGTAGSSPGWLFADNLIGTNTLTEIVRDNPQAELHPPSSRTYFVGHTFVNDSIALLISGGPVAPSTLTCHTYKITLSGTGSDPMLSGVAC